jgi:hypothetical protein
MTQDFGVMFKNGLTKVSNTLKISVIFVIPFTNLIKWRGNGVETQEHSVILIISGTKFSNQPFEK